MYAVSKYLTVESYQRFILARKNIVITQITADVKVTSYDTLFRRQIKIRLSTLNIFLRKY